MARLVFCLMQRENMGYAELEWRSGILLSTIKSWRNHSTPSLLSIEAVLGVFGYRLLPCPPLAGLPSDVAEQLDAIGQNFISDDAALAAMISAATAPPAPPRPDGQPAPLADYGRGIERGTRRFRRQVEAVA